MTLYLMAHTVNGWTLRLQAREKRLHYQGAADRSQDTRRSFKWPRLSGCSSGPPDLGLADSASAHCGGLLPC
jgi:hypothetical protein